MIGMTVGLARGLARSLARGLARGLARSLAGAAAILLAATMPGAAGDVPDAAWSELAGPAPGDEPRAAAPVRRLPLIGLRLSAAPVGLAVELADGVHIGAAGDFDPRDDEATGLIAFRLSL